MTLSPGQEATSPCDRGRENILLDPMDGDLHEPVMSLNTQHRVEGGPHVPCLMLFLLVSVKLQSRKYGTMSNAAVDFKFAMQKKKINNNETLVQRRSLFFQRSQFTSYLVLVLFRSLSQCRTENKRGKTAGDANER